MNFKIIPANGGWRCIIKNKEGITVDEIILETDDKILIKMSLNKRICIKIFGKDICKRAMNKAHYDEIGEFSIYTEK